MAPDNSMVALQTGNSISEWMEKDRKEKYRKEKCRK